MGLEAGHGPLGLERLHGNRIQNNPDQYRENNNGDPEVVAGSVIVNEHQGIKKGEIKKKIEKKQLLAPEDDSCEEENGSEAETDDDDV